MVWIVSDANTFSTPPVLACHCVSTGDGTFTRRTDAPIPAFVCRSNTTIELEQLCDGNNDCGDGDDEVNDLREST